MSRHYLLDGYNIINKIPRLTEGQLEDARRGLIHLIETARPQGSPRNSLTVVFDGKAGVWGGEKEAGEIRVVFTKDETADAKIKRMVQRSSRKKQITVVTDDREIRYYVSALGAAVMDVREFYSRLLPPDEKRKAADPRAGEGKSGPSKPISKSLEHAITSEFEKIWLERGRDKPPDR